MHPKSTVGKLEMANMLTVMEVKALKDLGLHADGQVPGPYINIAKAGSKSFIQRIMVGGQRRDIGLGGFSIHRSRNGAGVGFG